MQKIQQKKLRAALYARVSTEEQTNNYSISAQLEAVRSLGLTRGYEIVGEYVDGGQSGTVMSRPALTQLLEDCRNGKVQVIIVYKIDRFFRNTRHLLNVMEELEKMDVKFVSATEPFDTSTPVGKYIVGQFGLAADLERSTFMERAKLGRIKRFQEGKWWGKAPFGYKYNKDSGKLKIYEKEAEIVRLIYKMYKQPGMTLTMIASYLYKEGCLSKTGSFFNSSKVYDILSNKTYTGKTFFNAGKEKIIINVPQIITEHDFEEVQKLLNRRGMTVYKNRVKRIFLLKGLIYCGECGSRMGCNYSNPVHKKKSVYRYYYYTCMNTRLHSRIGYADKKCTTGWVRADAIEKAVWDMVVGLVSDPESVKKVIRRINNEETMQKDIPQLQHKVSKLSEQRKALFRSFREGLLAENDMRELLKELKEEEERLVRIINKREKPLKNIEQHIISFKQFQEMYRETINYLSDNERKEIIYSLINRVTFFKNAEIKVEFNAPDGCSPLVLEANLKRNDRYYRRKKPGRKKNKRYISINMAQIMWDKIKSECKNITPSEYIRITVEEWVNSGNDLPLIPLYRIKEIKNYSEKRISVLFESSLINKIKEEANKVNMNLTAAIRFILIKKLNM